MPASQLFGKSPGPTLALLRAAWPQAVGPELARRTEVLALEGDCLRLRVPDAGWRRNLLQMRNQILERLRGVAGELTPRRLSFTEGGIAPEREAPVTRPPLARPAPPSLASEAQVIVDDELRVLFLEVAARYLARWPENAEAGPRDGEGSSHA